MVADLKHRPYYTAEQYLAWEREAEERSEYIDGEIYAMAGESGAHADISMNLAVLLGNQLKGTDCRARTKDTKVRSGALQEHFGRGVISYPDMVVICGEPDITTIIKTLCSIRKLSSKSSPIQPKNSTAASSSCDIAISTRR
jgi:Uma2 family endonuclease